MSKLIPGSDLRAHKDNDPLWLVATDGKRIEVVESVPDWATLHWYLTDDPEYRPDFTRLIGYRYTAPNKLSKSNS